ncbi:MAG: NUDIX hydrolase [Thermoanaerobaculia bacterium]
MHQVQGEKKKIRQEHSAGGAVVALREGVPHVALIATRGKTRWGLPKGAVIRGETNEQAATREVLEETGLEGEVLTLLDTIEYQFRAGDAHIRKRVDFYLMRHTGGDLRPQLEEVDDVAWFPLEEAIRRSSFDSEKRILEMARGEWERLSQDERLRFAR